MRRGGNAPGEREYLPMDRLTLAVVSRNYFNLPAWIGLHAGFDKSLSDARTLLTSGRPRRHHSRTPRWLWGRRAFALRRDLRGGGQAVAHAKRVGRVLQLR